MTQDAVTSLPSFLRHSTILKNGTSEIPTCSISDVSALNQLLIFLFITGTTFPPPTPDVAHNTFLIYSDYHIRRR